MVWTATGVPPTSAGVMLRMYGTVLLGMNHRRKRSTAPSAMYLLGLMMMTCKGSGMAAHSQLLLGQCNDFSGDEPRLLFFFFGGRRQTEQCDRPGLDLVLCPAFCVGELPGKMGRVHQRLPLGVGDGQREPKGDRL